MGFTGLNIISSIVVMIVFLFIALWPITIPLTFWLIYRKKKSSSGHSGLTRTYYKANTRASSREESSEDEGDSFSEERNEVDNEDDEFAVQGGAIPERVEQKVVRKPKKKNPNAGLNALLYIGSLMVVAGVGSLTMTVVDDMAKGIIVIVMMLVFYAGGLLLRANKKLELSGNCMMGTAMAMVPFLTLVFENLFKFDQVGLSFLITGVIGMVMYIVSALLMRSQIVMYLAFAYLVVSATSLSSTFGLEMIWNFIFVMLAGVLCSIARFAIVSAKKANNEKSLINIIAGPIDVTGRWMTILSGVASLTIIHQTESYIYVILFGLMLIQELFIYLQTRSKLDQTLLRAVAQSWLMILAWWIFDTVKTLDYSWLGFTWVVICGIQAAVGLVLSVKGDKVVQTINSVGLVFMIGSIAIFSSMFLAPSGQDAGPRICLACASSAIVAGLAAAASRVYKMPGYLYVALVAIIACPAKLGGIIHDDWMKYLYFGWYAFWLVFSTILSVVAYLKKWALGYVPEVIMLVLSIALLFSSASFNLYWLAFTFALSGFVFVINGLITDRKVFTEAGVYVACLSAIPLTKQLRMEKVISSANDSTAICVHVGAVALIIGSIISEKKGVRIRLMSSIIGLSLMMGDLALRATNPVWQIVFLVEEALILGAGVILSYKWMWITGAVGAVLSIVWYTRSVPYVWLIALGIGLIVLAIVKTLKSGDNNKS